MGITFQNYVINLRLEQGKKLLSETNLSISEISEKIGYFSVSHFTKQFKKEYGVTPNVYRNYGVPPVLG
jgi:two-component system response regulator YesN